MEARKNIIESLDKQPDFEKVQSVFVNRASYSWIDKVDGEDNLLLKDPDILLFVKNVKNWENLSYRAKVFKQCFLI